mgnify:CR=1 FL=1
MALWLREAMENYGLWTVDCGLWTENQLFRLRLMAKLLREAMYHFTFYIFHLGMKQK